MQEPRPVIQWVSDSAVRVGILTTVRSEPTPTAALLDTVDASESAIYQAVTDLERRSLLTERAAGWIVTGRGQVVADLLGQRESVEQLLHSGGEYWQEHDLSVLPRRFRLRLGALADHDVLRVTDTDPNRVVRHLSNRVSESSSVQILAPVYQESIASAMPDTADTRLVLTPDVVEGTLEQDVEDPDVEPDNMNIRLGDVPIPLTLTDDALLVSFPTLDGQYDTRSEVLVESEAARRWGEDLFTYYWRRATPVPSE